MVLIAIGFGLLAWDIAFLQLMRPIQASWTWSLIESQLAAACPSAFLTALGFLVAFYLLLRTRRGRTLEQLVLRGVGATGAEQEPAAPAGSRASSWTWILAGLLVVATAFAILESIESYYFVQDDVLVSELPGILQGCRAMAAGEFPDWTPCLFMGEPTAGEGFYSLLYPPTFLSYAVARWGLGNEYLTMEVFAAIHLALGYCASFAAARAVGMRPALAFTAGISLVLSGYILIAGRSWHIVLPIVLWMPLLVLALQRWIEGRAGWRWLLLTSTAVAAFYYVGFPQLWFYGMLLLAVAAGVAILGRRVALRKVVWLAAACALGIALILPILTVQLAVTRSSDHYPYLGSGFDQGLWAVLAPYPLSRAAGFMPLPANIAPELETEWYYAGTVLMACAYVALGALLAYRWNWRWLGRTPWTLSALIALWVGMGNHGVLWRLMGMLPLLRVCSHHPHRMLPYFLLFGVLAGGLFLERVLSGSSGRKWARWIAVAVALAMLYHTSLSRNSFWSYGDRPYPPLPPELASRLLPQENPGAGRFLSYAPLRSGRQGFATGLPLSLASVYGAFAFRGYDPLCEMAAEFQDAQQRLQTTPVAACRAYGIRWLLIAKPDFYRRECGYWMKEIKRPWCIGLDVPLPEEITSLCDAASPCVQREELTLYELANVSPMAFDKSRPSEALPIRFRGWGADVEVPGGGARSVVVNVLARPWLRAMAGGRPLVSTADSWGRLQVSVPDGVQRIEVRCAMGWGRGIVLGLGLTVVALAGIAVFSRYDAHA